MLNNKKAQNEIAMGVIITVIVIFVLSVIFGCFYTIKSGEIGVVSTFGSLDTYSQGPGLHFKFPFIQRIHKVNVQTIQIEEEMAVPSKEGLVFLLDVSVIYNIVPEKVPNILLTINGNIRDTLVVPYLRSEVRDIVSGKEAKEIYSDSGRGEVANKLKESFSQSLAGHNYSLAREQNLRARKVIVDNPSCFTPEQVTQAELLVKENNEMCELARNENADYLERARGKTRCVDL
jgi:regulator of protease activity HflC (stomatin/prohibitin superfamily)